MRLNVVVLSVPLLMPLVLAAAPKVESASIRFVGSIVKTGCAVEPAGDLRRTAVQRLQVVPGVEVDVSTHQNACDGGVMPLSATFEPLHTVEPDGVPLSGRGIVTVTYR